MTVEPHLLYSVVSHSVFWETLGNNGLCDYIKCQVKSCICQSLPKELKCYYLVSFKPHTMKSLLQIFITFFVSVLRKHLSYTRGEGLDQLTKMKGIEQDLSVTVARP